jgi:hypothetical protein
LTLPIAFRCFGGAIETIFFGSDICGHFRRHARAAETILFEIVHRRASPARSLSQRNALNFQRAKLAALYHTCQIGPASLETRVGEKFHDVNDSMFFTESKIPGP